MMIIDQGDGPGYFPVVLLPIRLDQVVPNQVPDGLGTILIALLGDDMVESVQEAGVHRHTKAD
jgi:hypothetical protein